MAPRYFSVVARSFAKAADVDLVEVGYRTTSQALQDTVAGFTEMVFSSVAASSGLAEQGKLKRIAITSKARFPGVEELPTVGETLPGYSFEGYIPLLAPAGLPGEIAERINRKIDEVLREPEVLARFQTFGYATSGADTPEGVNEYIRADRERWKVLASELNLQPK